MDILELKKADGRRMWLYGRALVTVAQAPSFPPVERSAHMRWHPLAQEWVIYAAHRQERTFLPHEDPLAPTSNPDRPTELPAGEYDVAVFENRFPSLAADPGTQPPVDGVAAQPAFGRTEVVVFSQESTSLCELEDDHVALILRVLGHRTHALAAQGMRYVLPFENRGVEMGVTLHHPHAQIYAYPFLPGQQARTLYAQRAHYGRTGRTMVADIIEGERTSKLRLLRDDGDAISFVPPFARFPYETWVAPTRPGAAVISDMSEAEVLALARVLKDSLRRLDALFSMPMPYLMTFNHAPCTPCPEWTFRIEIWPIRRAANKLKYLAGTELGAGVFASDVTPEKAAEALRGALP